MNLTTGERVSVNNGLVKGESRKKRIFSQTRFLVPLSLKSLTLAQC